MEIKAVWKTGYVGKGNAQLCAEEIMSIGDDVSAEQIVEFDRNPESELHKLCYRSIHWFRLSAQPGNT